MKKKSKKELLMAGGLALEILVVLLFLNARINALLDSDMSSEMVLAQLLAKEMQPSVHIGTIRPNCVY